MCVILSANNPESWTMRRFVELIGPEPQHDTFEVLFGMYATNNLPDGESNEFAMLHPGNVVCQEIEAWPLPRHSGESQDGPGALEEIYGKAFEQIGDRLFQKETLTSWDSWREIQREPVYTLKCSDVRQRVSNQFEVDDPQKHFPFCAWNIGPFKRQGAHLLTFRLRLSEASYELVLRPYGGDDFRINGPEQVYDQLKFSDMNTLCAHEREVWERRLVPFDRNRLTPREGYDVLLLKIARTVGVDNLVGAMVAPIQPHDAERFISAHQSFTLDLSVK